MRRKNRTWVLVAAIVIGAIAVFGVTFGIVQGMARPDISTTTCLSPPVPCRFNIIGQIVLTSQGGAGTLNLAVDNLQHNGLVGISLVSVKPNLVGLANTVPFSYKGTSLSDAAPLQMGDYANADYAFTSGGNTATIYTITIRVTTTSDQNITESTTLSAIART